MKFVSSVSTVVGALLLVLGLSVALPTAAFAGTKPSCVKVSIRESNSGTFYSKEIATVTNNCTNTKRLKVIWHGGRDSDCMTVRPRHAAHSTAQLTLSHYDKTVTC